MTPDKTTDLSTALTEVPMTWSARVRDAATGTVLAEHHAARVLRTASVGKLFLLLGVARRIAAGDLDPHEQLSWTPEEWVADSGCGTGWTPRSAAATG